MAKAFSSQIKKMSKKPLKYNPEEVMVFKVNMAQDMFNYAMDIARESLGKFKKEDELPSPLGERNGSVRGKQKRKNL